MPQLFERVEFFHVNKSCKIECCDNKTHQPIQNMILSRSLELKLGLLRRTTISGQNPLIYRWGKVYEPLFPLKYNGSRSSHTFSHLKNKGCSPEIIVLHNRLSLSSKPQDSFIAWMIWCVLLLQYSILHDLFTWKNCSRLNNCDIHCTSGL